MVTAGANQVKTYFPILPCKVFKLSLMFPNLLLFITSLGAHSSFPVSLLDLELVLQSGLLLHLFFQAFVNLVLTLCDAGDSVVMFAPYYFNAYMSFQMTGVTDILVGDCDPKTLHPDVGKMTLLFFLFHWKNW